MPMDGSPLLSLACCVLVTGLLLLVILLPLSFSYVNYYEYGLAMRRGTGTVDITTVYEGGRYLLGPAYKFLKYRSDAHVEHLDQLSVFSAGGSNDSIGLQFLIDVDFTFLLNRDEIGLLYKELATSYESVIVSRAIDGIKNEAIYVTFDDYFRNRLQVEQQFRTAVQDRWNDSPSLHCTLDQFFLGRIQIPDAVADVQLQSRVQNEVNDKVAFEQQAQINREVTAVNVSSINLQADSVLRKAQAQADYVRSKAQVQAQQLLAWAHLNGTKQLLDAAGMITQEQKIALDYIRTLSQRDNLSLQVTHYSADSVLRTIAV